MVSQDQKSLLKELNSTVFGDYFEDKIQPTRNCPDIVPLKRLSMKVHSEVIQKPCGSLC